MSRAIVLLTCLLAAAGIAGYTYYSDRAANQTPVYTVLVPQRAPEQAAPAAPQPAPLPPHKATITAGDRASIARELQRELKRVGCYSGEINGVWTTSSRMAMKAFTDEVNASLPIDNPDYILLSLVQQRQGTVCNTTEAKAAPPPPPSDKTASPPVEKSATTVGAAVPAAAAAVTALTAATPPPAATPAPAPDAAKLPPKADDRPRTAATVPPPAEPAPKAALPDKSPVASGNPVPSEGVYERKSKRQAKRSTSRPPKFVRNVLRALGFR